MRQILVFNIKIGDYISKNSDNLKIIDDSIKNYYDSWVNNTEIGQWCKENDIYPKQQEQYYHANTAETIIPFKITIPPELIEEYDRIVMFSILTGEVPKYGYTTGVVPW